jgi:hypothetical protein
VNILVVPGTTLIAREVCNSLSNVKNIQLFGAGFSMEQSVKFPYLGFDFIDSWNDEGSLDKLSEIIKARDIDLTGKLKGFVCADVTSIGYMYRDSEDPYKTILSFETNELDLSTGSRSSHLRQKKFVISILNKETNVLTTDWEQIFPNAFKNYKK